MSAVRMQQRRRRGATERLRDRGRPFNQLSVVDHVVERA